MIVRMANATTEIEFQVLGNTVFMFENNAVSRNICEDYSSGCDWTIEYMKTLRQQGFKFIE